MPSLLLVMAGGAIGAGARHLVGRIALSWLGPNYPWGTLTVNLIGGFAMGILIGTLARTSLAGEQLRLLLGVGVLGGFTTFSAFSLDVVNMLERGTVGTALFYVLISVIGSIVALIAGLAMMRAMA
ncbi:fluoride efflux transporter CrcB [Sphingomonas japonica]|uniref:Fluoride-specific ion channel FluC n=1 Tax=Sphingomonas japonica TaxID=511662 RepID=A0ABX0TY31_9SPHN|nr:fluoride efflux transporter CrcB [Sphingomonas japonica]NIJ23225.1 CrcB protein [Sphingomonas japonica]